MKKLNLILILIIAGLSLIGLLLDFSPPKIPVRYNNPSRFHVAQPNEKEFFETAYSFVDNKIDLSNTKVVAGIIPHHLLAADLIADFFHNLEGKNYDTVILLGPNHFSTGESDIITSAYDWQTPYGILKPDRFILDELVNNNISLDIKAEEKVIDNEHSISSEVAFIKKTFPQATFVPLILKPAVDQETAEKLAQTLFKISQNKNILVLASVDFSHYKTSQKAQQDDKKSIATITNFDLASVYDIEVDSPSTIYTLLQFGQLSKTSFDILDNSNSAILSAKPDLTSTTSYITGYFKPPKISLLFVGDVMLDRNVETLIKQKGLDYIMGDLAQQDFFSGYDLVSANLEGAVTDHGKYYAPVKEFDFAFDPTVVAQLADYGFNFFNLANNHLADQGDKGVEETNKNLANLGFDFSGCQEGVIADCSSKIISIKGQKIGMIGLSVVGVKADFDKLQAVIDSLKDKIDWLVVNVHWGEEYSLKSNKSQQKIAHQLIDGGVDVIIGHHPHVVQEVEVYKNKPIFYSLGNFIFDQYFSDETQEGLAISLDFSDGAINYSVQQLKYINGRLGFKDL